MKMRSIPPKGLRDIKRGKGIPPRTWAFSTSPVFYRYNKEYESTLLVERLREPQVDLIGGAKDIVILIQLPSVKEEDIYYEICGDIFTLEAFAKDERGERKYEKELLLPFIVEEKPLYSNFEKGILEIKLQRKK